jgi:hypothetical protein
MEVHGPVLMANGSSQKGKIWLIVLIIIVALAAAAGVILVLRGTGAPANASMTNWEWHRTGRDAAGNIQGELALTGKAAHWFTISGIACNEVPLPAQSGLPQKIGGVFRGTFAADVKLVLPEPKKPLNLLLHYRDGKNTGQLGPIILFP